MFKFATGLLLAIVVATTIPCLAQSKDIGDRADFPGAEIVISGGSASKSTPNVLGYRAAYSYEGWCSLAEMADPDGPRMGASTAVLSDNNLLVCGGTDYSGKNFQPPFLKALANKFQPTLGCRSIFVSPHVTLTFQFSVEAAVSKLQSII